MARRRPMFGAATAGASGAGATDTYTDDTYAAPTKPTNNTGVSGYGPGGTPPPPVAPPPVTENHPNGPEPGRGTAPPGVDPAKWAEGHSSPKYAFMEVSRKYDQRTPEGRAQTLAELQSLYPQWYTGWVNDGDKLRFGGGQLHADWDGYDEFDAWRGSKAGEWAPQWIPTRRNGQAYIDPASAQGVGASGSGGGATATGAGGGTGTGAAPGMPTISPEAIAALEQLFASMGETYGGEQSPGAFPSEVGVQQVGQDPLSQLATGGLAALIQSGGAGYSAMNDDVDRTLAGLLDQEDGGLNEQIINARLESAREASERQRKASTDTLKAQLAGRGLLGSGPERTGLERIAETFNADQATALRDIYADEGEAADGRLMQALGLATGLGQSQTRSLLDSINSVTDRQQVLSDIALDTLDRNMAWNQFLAEFGLKRDQIMNEIRQGRIEGLIPLLQLFINSAGTAARGYV